MMRRLLAVLLIASGACLGQTNSVGPQMTAYINVSGAWTAATSTFTSFAIDNAPAVELYCLNTVTNKWVPWTSACAGGGGGGTGTVTSISITPVNGVSGTVANPTTTPAISLTLGAITPTSVTATGNITSSGNVIATGPPTSPVNVATQSSVQLLTAGGSNRPTIAHINSTNILDNRSAYSQWNGNAFIISGFANDAFTNAIPVITSFGGFAAGILGITSNSGSGSWTHTGPFVVTGNVTAPNLMTLGGTISAANGVAGTGAGSGTGGGIAAGTAGTDGSHQLVVFTGTLPTASGIIATVTFTTPRGHNSYCNLSPANSNAALLGTVTVGPPVTSNQIFFSLNTDTRYVLTAGSVALAGSTTYAWNITCP